MKTLKIFTPGLEIRNQQLVSSVGLKVLKLSQYQMMTLSLEDMEADFNKLILKFGEHNLLKEGEYYNGYALFYNGLIVSTVRMRGRITKVTDSRYAGWDNQMRQYIRLGYLYDITDRTACGLFKYVWSLSSTPWENMDGCSIEVGHSLRQKLADAVNHNYLITVTDEEDLVLKRYLGKQTYYKDFFNEIP